MSALGKLVTAVVAGAALTLVAGVPGALAQGPWVAPPEAKSLKNPVKGVGDAKKAVETNCVTCHGASGHGDGPAAAALPPPMSKVIRGPARPGRPDCTPRSTSRASSSPLTTSIRWPVARSTAATNAPPFAASRTALVATTRTRVAARRSARVT